MPRKRYSTEQIVTKLRQAEVELGNTRAAPEAHEGAVNRPLNASVQAHDRSLVEEPRLVADDEKSRRKPDWVVNGQPDVADGSRKVEDPDGRQGLPHGHGRREGCSRTIMHFKCALSLTGDLMPGSPPIQKAHSRA